MRFDKIFNVKIKQHPFGSTLEAIIYPLLLLVIMWLVYWGDHLFPFLDFYKFGVIPKDVSTLEGIVLMPLIHSKDGYEHILNNSVPTIILLGALVYYYRSIAFKVLLVSWLMTGLGLWLFATNTGSYHIGMSGVVYALAGFLFTSGVLRKFRPLQSISLFVVFVYGSLIWGVFPTDSHVSWEGHLSGLIVGVTLAFIYRKKGPQAPKYLYEIEKELGIEPPDLEGRWRENVRRERERLLELEAIKMEEELNRQREKREKESGLRIVYHYKANEDSQDDNDQQ